MCSDGAGELSVPGRPTALWKLVEQMPEEQLMEGFAVLFLSYIICQKKSISLGDGST